MGKVTGSSNKESGTNSYAKDNQSAIKALKTVGKAIAKGTIIGKIGKVVGSLAGVGKEKRTDKYQEKAKEKKRADKYQEKAKEKKEIEAIDV